MKDFIEANSFENAICNMAIFLFQPQCVQDPSLAELVQVAHLHEYLIISPFH